MNKGRYYDKAQMHIERCNKFFKNAIERAETKQYRNECRVLNEPEIVDTVFSIYNNGSIEAARAFTKQGHDVTILNFASYKHPGGGFANGMMAQEEALCHDTTLYPILCKNMDYYVLNEQVLNYGLYTNTALFTKGVVDTGTNREYSVLTCAAPNAKQYYRCKEHTPRTEQQVTEALKSRIEFIRDICIDNNVSTFIIGAWGCGVFKNDIDTVCDLFAKTFKRSSVKDIVFAATTSKIAETFGYHCVENGCIINERYKV